MSEEENINPLWSHKGFCHFVRKTCYENFRVVGDIADSFLTILQKVGRSEERTLWYLDVRAMNRKVCQPEFSALMALTKGPSKTSIALVPQKVTPFEREFQCCPDLVLAIYLPLDDDLSLNWIKLIAGKRTLREWRRVSDEEWRDDCCLEEEIETLLEQARKLPPNDVDWANVLLNHATLSRQLGSSRTHAPSDPYDRSNEIVFRDRRFRRHELANPAISLLNNPGFRLIANTHGTVLIEIALLDISDRATLATSPTLTFSTPKGDGTKLWCVHKFLQGPQLLCISSSKFKRRHALVTGKKTNLL